MTKNVIVGCASTRLTDNEKALFRELQPWGLIVFARNLENASQIKSLVDDMRVATNRDNVMVFIDQEGGRVSRLPKEHFRVPPSPTVFADMYLRDPKQAAKACFLNALLTGIELKQLGINANCAPMLDLPQSDSDAIVTERALGTNPEQVIDLALQICDGLIQAGVAPVIKHMPGHGRAICDSHLSLPQIDATLEELENWDFKPFSALKDQTMAMTAHIVFSCVDKTAPVTTNHLAFNRLVRQQLQYNGLVMSDDINMQALSGSIAERAQNAIDAGCDMVLQCSGEFEQMQSLLPVCTDLKGEVLARSQRAEQIAFSNASAHSEKDLREQLESMLSF